MKHPVEKYIAMNLILNKELSDICDMAEEIADNGEAGDESYLVAAKFMRNVIERLDKALEYMMKLYRDEEEEEERCAGLK